jgi:hypothetical protein
MEILETFINFDQQVKLMDSQTKYYPVTAIGRRSELLDARTDTRIRLDGPVNWILVVKTKKLNIIKLNNLNRSTSFLDILLNKN